MRSIGSVVVSFLPWLAAEALQYPLPRRLIELYTYADDVVLDPFIGSGTTAIAAEMSGRRWVGYEVSRAYARRARARVRDARLNGELARSERSFAQGSV